MKYENEDPFEDENSKMNVKQLATLKLHEKNHSGGNPYQCDTCNKSFKQKNNLKVHKMIHTDER